MGKAHLQVVVSNTRTRPYPSASYLLGTVLRRLKFDELPWLANVLKDGCRASVFVQRSPLNR